MNSRKLRSLMRVAVAILALALVSPASAQQALLQAGPRAGGHVPMYLGPTITGNFGQPILGDSGPASGGAIGVGLNELGLTVRGNGTPPYANAGTGPFGANLCDYDAPINNPTGYHYICLSPNTQGGESIIAGKGGSASPLPLQFIINGVVTPITGGGSGTVTSVTITAGTNVTTSGTCTGTTTINCTVNATGGGGGGGVVTTVAGLATAFPTPSEGQAAYVTDAVSCVFGAGLTGGGSGVPGCSVHYNGSAWTAG